MITVYSKPNCLNCVKAKVLLTRQSINFESIQINSENIESLKTAGARTAPAIFDGDTFLGGYVELKQFIKDYYEV